MMEPKRKFILALAAYLVLGLGAWLTLDDTPFRLTLPFGLLDGLNVKFRSATLVVLGGFALKSAIYWWRCRLEERLEKSADGAGPEELQQTRNSGNARA
jgi:hypothetical protein